MTTDTKTPPAEPITFRSETMPDWGVGLVVQDLPPYRIFFFENAGEKKFIKDKVKGLVPVTLEAGELAALRTRATGRRSSSPAKTPSRKPGAKKARFTTVATQLPVFERLFPGGFAGEAFVKERADKDAAIALANEKLSAAAFGSESVDEMFARACAVLGATNIVFPIEGLIPFKQLAGGDREKAVAGLKDLLHGTGSLGARIERFTSTLALKDGKGQAKKVTWPLATVFAGLFDPKANVSVKPTAFATQAAIVGVSVDKTQAVDETGYGLFLDVAKRTEQQLVTAGLQPRDLMDVYTFIWRTNADKA